MSSLVIEEKQKAVSNSPRPAKGAESSVDAVGESARWNHHAVTEVGHPAIEEKREVVSNSPRTETRRAALGID